MRNKTILMLALIIFLPLASADVLMELPKQDSNIDSLQKNYNLGFVNTGSESINLTLNSSSQTDLSISHPQGIILQPSEITSSPEGEGWYYLGDQRYAKIQYVDFEAAIPRNTNTRSHEFDLSISRVYETKRSRPNVETVQEAGFTIFSTSENIDTGFQESSKDTETEDQTQNVEKEKEEHSQFENSGSPNETADNASRTSPSDQLENPSSSVDGVTILLVLGILLAVAWIYREVLM